MNIESRYFTVVLLSKIHMSAVAMLLTINTFVFEQIGDFVDAQDPTDKWYEAVVRDVTDDTVIVHYFGWASRWDSRLPRHSKGPVPERVKPVRAHRCTKIAA